jgi:O-antigen/teichoic acid export membrane protein
MPPGIFAVYETDRCGPKGDNIQNSNIKINSVYNLLGQLLPSLVGLLSVPILIRHIGSDRFGIITVVWMVIGYFGLFDVGLGRALTQLVAEKLGGNEKEQIPAIFWTAMVILSAVSAVGSLSLFVTTPTLVTDILKITPAFRRETVISFHIVACGLPFVIVAGLLTGYLSAHQRFGIINLVRFPMAVYSFAAPLVVLPYTSNLVPIIAILVAGRIISFAIYFHFCLKISPELSRGMLFDRSLIAPLFRFGGWMTVSNLISPLMVYFDRIFISSALSVAAVAYYTTPFEFVTRLSLIPIAVISVLFPAFASSHTGDLSYSTALYNRALKYLLMLLFPLVLAIVTGAHQLMAIWIGESFAGNSYRILQFLAVGVFVNCLALVPCTFLQGIGKPEICAKFHLVEVILYAPILWWMVKEHGIIGASCAWSLRMLVDAALLFSAVRYSCRPNRLLPASLLAVMVFCLCSLLFIVPMHDTPVKYLASLTFFIIAELLVLLGLTSSDERKGLLRLRQET